MGGLGVTVAIPTTGDRPGLRAAVEAVICSAERLGGDAEVLVVVNGRRSAPALERVGSPLLRVVFLDEANVSVARNTAIAVARYDTVLFTDDDGVVGEDWCAQLGAGLAVPGCALVAGPVRVPASGPVTALLDYQRPFDATPAPDGGVIYPVALNCGIRRDRLPVHVRFDPALRTGEDADFGAAAAAAGARLAWHPEAAVVHLLPDQLPEIAARFPAYGAGIADVDRKRHRVAGRVAGFLGTYRRMIGPGSGGLRRFSEFAEPRAREAFVILDYLVSAFYFTGYLRRAGSVLGQALITVDEEGLQAVCRELAGPVVADAGGLTGSQWRGLCPDYRLLGQDTGPEPAALGQLREAFAELARPAPDPAGQLAAAGQQRPAGQNWAAMGQRAWSVWQDLCAAGGRITTAGLEQAFRSAGVPFKEGCRQVETRLLRERSMTPQH